MEYPILDYYGAIRHYGCHQETKMVTGKKGIPKRIPAPIAGPADPFRPGEEFLTTREAAALTKISPAYYEKMRWMKVGPPYLKRGKNVRYLKSQLLEWWAENPDQ